MAATFEQIEKAMEKMGMALEKLEKQASTPRSKATSSPSNIFAAGLGVDPLGDANWRNHPKLQKRCEQLNKSYNSSAVTELLSADNNGRARGLGMGPMLKSIVEHQRGNPQYSLEILEKEYGLVTFDKAERVGVKGVNGEVRKTALAEGSGLTGGYIVPPQFQNELLTIAAEDAWFESKCKVMPMTTRTLTLPSLDITTAPSAGTAPYFGGVLASWQPEAATINETEPQFRQTELTAWDLMLYSVTSNQLLADNAIGLDAFMTQLFGAAIPYYKELAFLNGLGTGGKMPLGVLNAPATITITRNTSSHVLLSDIVNMMAHLHVRSWKNAFWCMHQSVLPELLAMTGSGAASNTPAGLLAATSDRPWFLNQSNPSGGALVPGLDSMTLLGLPIMWTDKIPKMGTKGDVILMNGDYYLIGNRMDLQIDVSTHYLFRNNQLAWRVIARCDGRPWLNSYITDQAGWISSPLIALATTSGTVG